MRNGDKMLLFLYLIVTTCIFAVFIILPTGYIHDSIVNSVFQDMIGAYKWYYFAAAFILLIVNILLFAAIFKGNKTRNFGIIKTTENGEVNISYDTIKSLVVKTISGTKGVKDSKVSIYPGQDNIRIMIRAYILADVNIPQTVKEIQENVKKYVEATAEVPVGEIKVAIIDVAPAQKLRLE